MFARIATIAFALTLVVPAAGHAERKRVEPGPWKLGATAGLNLSQSSFSSNWAGGDRGSIVWVLNSTVGAERQFTRAFNLSNQLQLAYGQTARQVQDAADPQRLTWDVPEKSTDLITFESVGRFSLDGFVDPYFSLRLDSQFKDQSNPAGDLAFNPVKLKQAAGIARVLEKDENRELITRFGFGFRQTVARTFADPATGRTKGFTSVDGGLEWQTGATRPLLGDKVLYKATLLVFQPLFYSKAAALEAFDTRARGEDPARESVADYWRATDVNFQNTFSAEITKHLSVILYAQFVYDKFDAAADVDNRRDLAALIPEIDRNVRKAGQFKETLALGLTYRLL